LFELSALRLTLKFLFPFTEKKPVCLSQVHLIDHGHVVVCRSSDLRLGAYFVHVAENVVASPVVDPAALPFDLPPEEDSFGEDGEETSAHHHQFSPVRLSYADEAVGPGCCAIDGLAKRYRLFGIVNWLVE
jgi:hypothetical protein